MRKPFSYVSLLLVLVLGVSASLQAQDKDQKKFKRFKFGPAINTLMYDEYAPTISRDNKTLIFQSNRDGKKWNNYRLYQSVKDENGKWDEPTAIEAINGQAGDNSVIAGPYLSYDGLSLYFSASFDDGGGMDIYVSTREDEESDWGEPVAIDGVNTGDYEGFPTISADGQRLYFMRRAAGESGSASEGGSDAGDSEASGSSGNGQTLCYKLMVSKKMKDGSFGTPEELPAPINADCDKAVRILPDGETLYFASMRDGAKKGIRVDARDFDLFMTQLEEGGSSWSEPKPMDFANHLSSDLYPSVVPADGSTTGMYFSADMNASHEIFWTVVPEGFGPKNVYGAGGVVLDSITREPVVIEDLPVDNMTRSSLSYSVGTDENGKFSTYMTEGNQYKVTAAHPDYITKEVVYDFQNPVYDTYKEILLVRKGIDVNITTVDLITEEPVDSKLSLTDANSTSIDVEKKGAGKFYSRLDPGKTYTANATADGYEDESASIDLTNAKFGETVEEIIEMFDASSIAFDNINYATARPRTMNERELDAALDATARGNLDKVAQFMKDYPQFGMDVSAHTDYRGGDDYNQGLSDRRAAAAVAYLKTKGIDASRLRSKGYGESNPSVPNEVDGRQNDQNMALNRRVEFKPFRLR